MINIITIKLKKLIYEIKLIKYCIKLNHLYIKYNLKNKTLIYIFINYYL